MTKPALNTNGDTLDRANAAWVLILGIVGLGGSLIISCVTPFVALAVALAGTVRLGRAIKALLAIWAINQCIGFVFLHFPLTAFTLLWGAALGVASILTTTVAAVVLGRSAPLPALVRLVLAFLLAFCVFELGLAIVASFVGGLETFSPRVVAQVGFSNLVWFAAIVALNELTRMAGKPLIGPMPRLLKAS